MCDERKMELWPRARSARPMVWPPSSYTRLGSAFSLPVRLLGPRAKPCNRAERIGMKENAALTFYTDADVTKPNHRDRAKLMGIPLAQRLPDYRSVNAGRTHLKPPLPSDLHNAVVI